MVPALGSKRLSALHAITVWRVQHGSLALGCKPQSSIPGPILSTADIFREEQYQARGMFEQAAPPSKAGPTITVPAMVPVLSRTPGEALTTSSSLLAP